MVEKNLYHGLLRLLCKVASVNRRLKNPYSVHVKLIERRDVMYLWRGNNIIRRRFMILSHETGHWEFKWLDISGSS